MKKTQSRRPEPGSSRRALMKAALELLERDGVLAGLNLSEVAKEAGITPANVYHLFGSRQGLLREAIGEVLADLAPSLAAGRRELRWPERPERVFRLVSQDRRLGLMALLALDRDPDLAPLPFLAETRAVLERDVAEGDLPPGGDLDVINAIILATVIGYSIFRESAARQLATTTEDLDRRAEAVFARLVEGLAPGRSS